MIKMIFEEYWAYRIKLQINAKWKKNKRFYKQYDLGFCKKKKKSMVGYSDFYFFVFFFIFQNFNSEYVLLL